MHEVLPEFEILEDLNANHLTMHHGLVEELLDLVVILRARRNIMHRNIAILDQLFDRFHPGSGQRKLVVNANKLCQLSKGLLRVLSSDKQDELILEALLFDDHVVLDSKLIIELLDDVGWQISLQVQSF